MYEHAERTRASGRERVAGLAPHTRAEPKARAGAYGFEAVLVVPGAGRVGARLGERAPLAAAADLQFYEQPRWRAPVALQAPAEGDVLTVDHAPATHAQRCLGLDAERDGAVVAADL